MLLRPSERMWRLSLVPVAAVLLHAFGSFAATRNGSPCHRLDADSCRNGCQWLGGQCRAACIKAESQYVPLSMAGTERSVEQSLGSCRRRCLSTPNCYYYTWFNDGGCHLEDAAASETPGEGAIAGVADCEDSCFEQDAQFLPTMVGVTQTKTATAEACQAHCLATDGCAHFTWWLNGGCSLQDAAASKATAIGTVTGPLACAPTKTKVGSNDSSWAYDARPREALTKEACYGQLEADCGGACGWDGTACSDVCLKAKSSYAPDMKGQERTVEVSLDSCQRSCLGTPGCVYFTYWNDGGCHLHDSSAEEQAEDSAIAGVATCSATCLEPTTSYQPDMGKGRSDEKTAIDCQARCMRTEGCAHFSWWFDGGCHLQNASAKRNHPEPGARAGPRVCNVVCKGARVSECSGKCHWDGNECRTQEEFQWEEEIGGARISCADRRETDCNGKCRWGFGVCADRIEDSGHGPAPSQPTHGGGGNSNDSSSHNGLAQDQSAHQHSNTSQTEEEPCDNRVRSLCQGKCHWSGKACKAKAGPAGSSSTSTQSPPTPAPAKEKADEEDLACHEKSASACKGACHFDGKVCGTLLGTGGSTSPTHASPTPAPAKEEADEEDLHCHGKNASACKGDCYFDGRACKPKPGTAPSPTQPSPIPAPVKENRHDMNVECNGKNTSVCNGDCYFDGKVCKAKPSSPKPAQPSPTPAPVKEEADEKDLQCHGKNASACKGDCHWDSKTCKAKPGTATSAPVKKEADDAKNVQCHGKSASACKGDCHWDDKACKAKPGTASASQKNGTGLARCEGKGSSECSGSCHWNGTACMTRNETVQNSSTANPGSDGAYRTTSTASPDAATDQVGYRRGDAWCEVLTAQQCHGVCVWDGKRCKTSSGPLAEEAECESKRKAECSGNCGWDGTACTRAAEVTSKEPTCSKDGANCKDTKCCTNPGSFCFKKNDHWASCNRTCNEKVVWNHDKQKFEEQDTKVWDCHKLSCTANGANCMASKCCLEPGMTCFKKNDHWSSCNATCNEKMLWNHDKHVFEEQDHKVWDCTALSEPPQAAKAPRAAGIKSGSKHPEQASHAAANKSGSKLPEQAANVTHKVANTSGSKHPEAANVTHKVANTSGSKHPEAANVTHTVANTSGSKHPEAPQAAANKSASKLPEQAEDSIPIVPDSVCFMNDTRYDPINMQGQDRIQVESAHACQQRCANTHNCKHFSTWADGGCHLQDAAATALSEDGAVTGPAVCPAATKPAQCESLSAAECGGWQGSHWCQWDFGMCRSLCRGKKASQCGGHCSWSGGACRLTSAHCFQEHLKYEPLDMADANRSDADTAHVCQQRCARTTGCKHFSWWSHNKGCHLQDALSMKFPDRDVIAGPDVCEVVPVKTADCEGNNASHCHGDCWWDGSACHKVCYTANARYVPLDMYGQSASTELSASACQKRCAKTQGCEHFSFFYLTESCHLQSAAATRREATQALAGNSACGSSCFDVDTHYEPVDMPGEDRTHTDSTGKCQERCAATKGCRHFSWWFGGACRLQDQHSVRVMSEIGVLAGPPACDPSAAKGTTSTTTFVNWAAHRPGSNEELRQRARQRATKTGVFSALAVDWTSATVRKDVVAMLRNNIITDLAEDGNGKVIGFGNDSRLIEPFAGLFASNGGLPSPVAMVPKTIGESPTASSKRWYACTIDDTMFKLAELEVYTTPNDNRLYVRSVGGRSKRGYPVAGQTWLGDFATEASMNYDRMDKLEDFQISDLQCRESRAHDQRETYMGALSLHLRTNRICQDDDAMQRLGAAIESQVGVEGAIATLGRCVDILHSAADARRLHSSGDAWSMMAAPRGLLNPLMNVVTVPYTIWLPSSRARQAVARLEASSVQDLQDAIDRNGGSGTIRVVQHTSPRSVKRPWNSGLGVATEPMPAGSVTAATAIAAGMAAADLDEGTLNVKIAAGEHFLAQARSSLGVWRAPWFLSACGAFLLVGALSALVLQAARRWSDDPLGSTRTILVCAEAE